MSKSPNADSATHTSISTPKSNSKKSPSNLQGLSPIFVPDSPVTRSPQTGNLSGNLTGNPRKVRDCAAEIFNLIQEWNSLHLKGVSLLTNITNLKLSALSETNIDETDYYPAGINELVENLNTVCQKMGDIVERMDCICKELNCISKLEYFRNPEPSPMFLTWPPEKFGETAEQIYVSYSKELKLKSYIKENIAHSFNKTNVLFHSVSWLHQPYIDDSVNVILEAMLKESGHR